MSESSIYLPMCLEPCIFYTVQADVAEEGIHRLPPEVLTHIFSFLPTLGDLYRVVFVCSKWRDIARQAPVNYFFHYWGFQKPHFKGQLSDPQRRFPPDLLARHFGTQPLVHMIDNFVVQEASEVNETRRIMAKRGELTQEYMSRKMETEKKQLFPFPIAGGIEGLQIAQKEEYYLLFHEHPSGEIYSICQIEKSAGFIIFVGNEQGNYRIITSRGFAYLANGSVIEKREFLNSLIDYTSTFVRNIIFAQIKKISFGDKIIEFVVDDFHTRYVVTTQFELSAEKGGDWLICLNHSYIEFSAPGDFTLRGDEKSSCDDLTGRLNSEDFLVFWSLESEDRGSCFFVNKNKERIEFLNFYNRSSFLAFIHVKENTFVTIARSGQFVTYAFVREGDDFRRVCSQFNIFDLPEAESLSAQAVTTPNKKRKAESLLNSQQPSQQNRGNTCDNFMDHFGSRSAIIVSNHSTSEDRRLWIFDYETKTLINQFFLPTRNSYGDLDVRLFEDRLMVLYDPLVLNGKRVLDIYQFDNQKISYRPHILDFFNSKNISAELKLQENFSLNGDPKKDEAMKILYQINMPSFTQGFEECEILNRDTFVILSQSGDCFVLKIFSLTTGAFSQILRMKEKPDSDLFINNFSMWNHYIVFFWPDLEGKKEMCFFNVFTQKLTRKRARDLFPDKQSKLAAFEIVEQGGKQCLIVELHIKDFEHRSLQRHFIEITPGVPFKGYSESDEMVL